MLIFESFKKSFYVLRVIEIKITISIVTNEKVRSDIAKIKSHIECNYTTVYKQTKRLQTILY